MKRVVLGVFLPLLLIAADKLQPLNAKLGLWEITTTSQFSGLPPIPADVLAKMSPEQRAKMEAMFKQKASHGGVPTTSQTCVTQEKLNKAPFSEGKQSCQRTIISSTSQLAEFREECTEPDGTKRIMDGKFELSGDTNMKGSMKVKASGSGKAMNVNLDMSGKWIGSDCGAKH